MKIERTSESIDIYGTVYKTNRPSYGRAMELGKQSDDKKEGEAHELMLEFLEERGIPKDVTLEMEVDHVSMLIEHFMPAKKK